jgi:Ca-activated chloride channel family protein
MLKSPVVAAALLGCVAAVAAWADNTIEPEDPILKGRYVQIEKVQMVMVPTTVMDGRGRPVAGLSRDDFRLSENGKPIDIEFFATEANAPVAIAFLLDLSGSMRQEGKLQSAKNAIHSFINALGPEDQYGLIGFADEQVTWITDFTSDAALFKRRLDVQQGFGQTALFDALAASPGLVQEQLPARKAIVLFSDGLDNHSDLDALRAVQTARQASVPIYAISFLPAPLQMLSQAKKEAVQILERFARETGGRAFTIETPPDLPAAVQRIQTDLRHQYVIGFQPPPREGDQFRRIRLETRKAKLRVQCRAGYYLGS